MSARFDALVIGGNASGLAAAALLAKSGLKTLLVERAATLAAPSGGPTLRALDPRVVKELRLAKHGLRFAVRDLALTVLRTAAAPLILGGDRHAATRSLVAQSPADAAAYAATHDELLQLARALRAIWWDGRPIAETAAALKPAQRALFARLGVTSAAAFLASRFENDALKAALAADAAALGHAPHEPGSALALLWSASQEMCGRQGAVALPREGLSALVTALTAAAKAHGAEIRLGATASALRLSGERAAGVELASGEQIDASLVLSTLSRRRTLSELAPLGAAGLGWMHERTVQAAPLAAATLVFGLQRAPSFGGILAPERHRFVIAEHPATIAAAVSAARLDQIPDEPLLELVLLSYGAPATPPRLAVRVWPLPAQAPDRDALAAKVIPLIDRHLPGFAASIPSCDLLPPADENPPSIPRLLASAAERIGTPIAGLFLCGRDAEPADTISARAARQAAHMALAFKRGAP